MRKLQLVGIIAAIMLVAACAPQRRTELPSRTQTKIGGSGVPATGTAAGDRVRVALLVPLSGEAAAIGEQLVQAAQLAVEDTGDDRLVLLPRDTPAAAETAATAARGALGEGARAILGPLYGSATRAVAPLARAAQVPVLSFSNDTAAGGPGVALFGFSPEDQVARIVAFAADRGKRRLAVLAPDDAFGQRFVAAAREAVAREDGMRLVGAGVYPADKAAPSDVVRRLVWPGGEPADPASAPPPDPFDAVLIGDTGARLRTLVSLINYYDVDLARVQLLGTQRWLDGGAPADPLLAGAWLAAPDPAALATFDQRYQEMFGERPARVAVLAYDATALVARLARQPGGPSSAALYDPEGFVGRSGVFRILPDGRVERALAVLELQAGGGTTVVDPAPRTLAPTVPTN